MPKQKKGATAPFWLLVTAQRQDDGPYFVGVVPQLQLTVVPFHEGCKCTDSAVVPMSVVPTTSIAPPTDTPPLAIQRLVLMAIPAVAPAVITPQLPPS
jgi:hypothetical protein